MKIKLICLFLFLCSCILNAQGKIPESIKTDLILKPSAKPYESTGFIVEKGVTLTIMPGTKINMSVKVGDKAPYPTIKINGTLKVGAKAPSSAPVIIEGNGPLVDFTDSNIEINGLEIRVNRVRFFGSNAGTIKNCSFLIVGNPAYVPTFTINVPKSGNLTLENCLIEGQGLDIISTDFPNDLDKLSLIKCSFTTNWSATTKKFKQYHIPITTFAYGTKCDCHIEIEFKAFDWVLKKPLATEWYIADERLRKLTEDSLKSAKAFTMKLPTKPFTTYKQDEAPTAKAEKK